MSKITTVLRKILQHDKKIVFVDINYDRRREDRHFVNTDPLKDIVEGYQIMDIDSIIMVITLTNNRRECYNYIFINIWIVSSIVIIYLGVITFRIEYHYEIAATSYYYYLNIFQSGNYGRIYKAK